MNTHFLKNIFGDANKYKSHSQAVIIACFYNPENSIYRLLAFQKWYSSIKHLNHRIIECVIGNNKPQLPASPYIQTVSTESLLWHKEALLNKLIDELPAKFKYVFWLDADVIFTNKNWMVESVEKLKKAKIIQPFQYGVHLNKNEMQPAWHGDVKIVASHGNIYGLAEAERNLRRELATKNIWTSFCSNHPAGSSCDSNYDVHGHVGFAWGAQREVLDCMPLYDRALIGGADHIIAHAAAGHIPHPCITKSFTEDIVAVEKWMRNFYSLIQGKIDFTPGYLYHIWHGDIDNRQYLKRIKEFTPQAMQITQKDANGLYVCKNNTYIKNYYRQREYVSYEDFSGFDIGFFQEMGYYIADFILSVNNQTYDNQTYYEEQQEIQPEIILPSDVMPSDTGMPIPDLIDTNIVPSDPTDGITDPHETVDYVVNSTSDVATTDTDVCCADSGRFS